MSIAEVIAADTSGLLNKHTSWERVPLAQVAEILNGAPFDSSLFSNSDGMPLARIRDVLTGDTSTYYTGPYEETFIIRQGDLLVGMDGDFNSGFWGIRPALLNQRVCKITPDEQHFDKRLLSFALPGYLAAINANTPSVTVKHLSSRTIGEIELPLPPRAEQTRIVAKLEELLSDLDAGVAELKAAQKKLGQYRQSLLKAAVEGALTAEWRANNTPVETGAQLLERILIERRTRWEAKQLAKFEEQGKTPPKDWQKKYPEPVQPDTTELPELPEGWVWTSLDMLGEIASGVAKGTKRKDSIEVREVPYLRVANVQRGYLDLSEVKTILATEKDIKELTLQAGDILFNEGGDRDKLGRGWVWRNEVENCIHQNHVFRMRPFLPEVLPELISHHGNTFGKTWFQNAGKQTTNLASINMTMLRMFPIPLGPADEQRELLTQLDIQIEQLDHQERAVELGLKQSTAQRQNILRAAFAGELVPQDPDDEPASVLLERIRAERAERAKQPKKRQPKKQKEITALVSKLIDVLAEAGDWLEAQEAFRRCGVADGALTERIEELYAELRRLDKDGRLAVEAIKDTEGRKIGDRIKLLAG
ncbi:restriction endonuclease subunit S [Shewanella mangrovisoli]|uniref:Restriction endonuclease subunit S n=1 Tax=Shewanella mangrovisoli TaxID=2864211 RepID=A0ABV4VDN7_9GAMM